MNEIVNKCKGLQKLRFKMTKKINLNALYLFVSLLIISCDGEKCEGFNLKRLPFKKSHYMKTLKYTDGADTLILLPKVVEYSRESELNPMSNPECNPAFSIEYSMQSGAVLNILYSFSYYPENNDTQLFIFINSCSLELKLDDLFKQESDKTKKYVIANFETYKASDTTRMIKEVVLDNMILSEIVTYEGVKWSLIR